MLADHSILTVAIAAIQVPEFVGRIGSILLVLLGFSLVVFVHELGHFLVAKWAGVRVDKFCVGFGRELVGFTRGQTRYSFNILPLGGYVKMLGQEDIAVDKDGDWTVKHDPDSFTSKSVPRRMAIVSAGVVMNLAFAAVAFMIVYSVGLDALAPVVGIVAPGSPADLAGIQVGDRVVRIDGSATQTFQDIKMKTVLAEPHEPMSIETERNGEVTLRRLVPETSRGDGLLWLGIGPGFTNRIAMASDYISVPDRPGIEQGDLIAEVRGQPADSFLALWRAMLESNGNPIALTVSRNDPDLPDQTPVLKEVFCRVPFDLQPSVWNQPRSKHFLGFVPRRTVLQVSPNSRAALAGFQTGDVVVRWADVDHPDYNEIIESIQANEEADIRVRVLRDREYKDLVVRPSRSGGWFRKGKVMIGVSFEALEENAVSRDGQSGLAVADVWPQIDDEATPAAALVAPDGAGEPIARGALIQAVDGEPLTSWNQLVRIMLNKANQMAQNGRDADAVNITYCNPDGVPQTRSMLLPTCLRAAAGLSGSAFITSIDGEKWVNVRRPDGRDREISVSHWRGTREILRRRVGQNVEIVYFQLGQTRPERTTFTVTERNTDPWASRRSYTNALMSISPVPVTEPVKASNPFNAVWIGVRQTHYTILNVYTTMQRMIFTRTVGVENMSGPVGIIKMGSDIARADLNRLLWFLAWISTNLAVINFLPLPIVDGGLMVFLFIELIKGQPVSLKTQVVTQMIGLALIIAAFVFVTAMDISKIAAP